MPDSQNIQQLTGIIQFDISESLLKATLANAVLTESTVVLLMNSSGDVIDAAGADAASNAAGLWARAVSTRRGDFSAEGWAAIRIGGNTYLAGSQGIDGTDWVLLIALPDRDIVRVSAQSAQKMLLVFLAIIPLTLFFAFFVSRSATKRIKGLIGQMDKVVLGDFSVTLDPGNRDEIGQLTERFNFMIAEVGHLMDDTYRLGKEVKNLELKALQAQINPHFLYNTLDLINWMSQRHHAAEIGTLVTALSRFYKLSLSKGEDMVRVRDELEHARAYVQIQNMRYENAIELLVDAPEAILECRILKLIIQPLVENAIFHGIMLTQEEKGTVRITGERVDGTLLLYVHDDGVGMPEERARALLSTDSGAGEFHGYGVRNIHERLQLSYGPEFGLSFSSAPGKGTTVRITLPADDHGGARERSAGP